MCGIIGVIAANTYGLTNNEQKLFEQLLYVDALRGDDATGIFVVSKTAEVKVAKEALDAYTMAYMDGYKEIVDYAYKEGRAAIGHNRKKTVGANTDASAHPFVVNDEFVFVHNGTLYQHDKLAPNCDVDSEALAIHLHAAFDPENTEEDAIDKAFHEIYGAYACVFYDQRSEKLYMVRNKDRPLSLVAFKDGGYAIVSEYMMGVAMGMRNSKIIDQEASFHLEAGTLYSFDLSKDKVSKPHSRKLKEKPISFTQAPNIHTSLTVIGGRNSNITSACDVNDVLSKNAFKRFRARYAGRKVSFVVEDYYERDPLDPSTVIDWIIVGSLEFDQRFQESTYPHTVSAVVTAQSMSDMIDNYTGCLHGIVDSIEYNKVKKQAEIHIRDISLPNSREFENASTTSYQH